MYTLKVYYMHSITTKLSLIFIGVNGAEWEVLGCSGSLGQHVEECRLSVVGWKDSTLKASENQHFLQLVNPYVYSL